MIRLVLLWCCYLLCSAQVLAKNTYSFAVVPQQASAQLAQNWMPLLHAISAKSGIALEFVTAPNIPEFERRLQRGEYDFAYMNPYHYTLFSQAPGYVALAKEKEKRIRGIVVVAKHSPAQKLADLNGEALAFPSPNAFAATLLVSAQLQRQGIAFSPNFVSSHDSVYRSVAAGLFAAGGGIIRTFKAADKQVTDQLRVLWESDGYTPHAIAAHPEVSQATRLAIQFAFSSLSGEQQAKLLGPLKMNAFEPASDSDWDDVRALMGTQPVE